MTLCIVSIQNSYITTKAPCLMGYSRHKNGNCNITIDIMDFEEYDDKMCGWTGV